LENAGADATGTPWLRYVQWFPGFRASMIAETT
jgi:hypothetical protein